MPWRLIKTIIVLPGNVLVFIPAVILWLAKDTKYSAELATPGRKIKIKIRHCFFEGEI